jgi:hypothetical protein
MASDLRSVATFSVLVGLSPAIHEFTLGGTQQRQANSWMVVPSTTMTK